MVGRAISAIARISRIDTSLVVFLSLGVPLYFKVHSVELALAKSLPILAIAMCGFILNDIHDIERDRENHPDRPLPRKQLSETQAAVLYFSLLSTALVMLRIFVDVEEIFLYLLLLIALINYNYIVDYFPYLKNVYVACVGIIPLLILSLLLKRQDMMLATIPALFAFLLGREILMDVEDLRGDGTTLSRVFGPRVAIRAGFCLKAAAGATLLVLASNNWMKICAVVMLGFDAAFVLIWFKASQIG